ncbi:MAG: GtrA family protein [Variovorax sp.]|nr:MAG: GtrA family protein [Variovorax sp.]
MTQRLRLDDPRVAEVGRFIANGLMATAVHYAVLTLNLRMLGVPSAGVANFVAAWFGIGASFIGNRFFVFPRRTAPVVRQAVRFLALYATMASLHGLLLFAWTDVLHLDYTAGFVIAAALQAMLSYLGNKLFVFTAS